MLFTAQSGVVEVIPVIWRWYRYYEQQRRRVIVAVKARLPVCGYNSYEGTPAPSCAFYENIQNIYNKRPFSCPVRHIIKSKLAQQGVRKPLVRENTCKCNM